MNEKEAIEETNHLADENGSASAELLMELNQFMSGNNLTLDYHLSFIV